MSKRFKSLSKTIAYALRHNPGEFDLKLDDGGWVNLDVLIDALKSSGRAWSTLSGDEIKAMIAAADKKRYEIIDGRIRAIYGHSSDDISISYTASQPPDLLFHGTTPKALEVIRIEGLKPMNRKFVHLSPDIETAMVVAKRRTNSPVIITVNTQRACQAGLPFFYGHDGVWMTEALEAQYLTFP